MNVVVVVNRESFEAFFYDLCVIWVAIAIDRRRKKFSKWFTTKIMTFKYSIVLFTKKKPYKLHFSAHDKEK